MRRLKERERIKKIALERIKILFDEAKKAKKQEFSDRYVEIARKIAMKAKVRIPPELKRKFCKKCHSYFRAGNFRVRLQGKKVVYYCFRCKNYMRFPYTKNKMA